MRLLHGVSTDSGQEWKAARSRRLNGTGKLQPHTSCLLHDSQLHYATIAYAATRESCMAIVGEGRIGLREGGGLRCGEPK